LTKQLPVTDIASKHKDAEIDNVPLDKINIKKLTEQYV
jgi:hypothetical protein